MTTATPNDLTEAATLRELLFGAEVAEPIDALAESLREHGTVKSLVNGFPGLTAAVEREVATEASALLSLNLLDLAVAGWQRYEALMEAARRTQDAPTTTEEIVALVTHRIESSQPLTIEVLVDGESVGTIEVKLDVAFELAGVLAVVRQARLTAVRSGTCTVTGTLAMQRTVVAHGQRGLDLPGAVQLRRGVGLLEPVASAACVEPPVVGSGQSPSADWYPDPTRRYELRRWDGSRWTDHVATRGHVASDPVPHP